MTNHQSGQFLSARFGRVNAACHLAASQHGSGIAKLTDFFKLVRDKQYSNAAVTQFAQRIEQGADVLWWQYRGWFVEYQQF